jgi:hypothetical protein
MRLCKVADGLTVKDRAGYRSGWIEQIDVAGNGTCFPGMQKLIVAECISGVRIDSNDCKQGYGQASCHPQPYITNRYMMKGEE